MYVFKKINTMNIIFEILLCFNIERSIINIIITLSMKKVFDTIKQQKLSATDYFGNYLLQALDIHSLLLLNCVHDDN